MWTTSSSSRTSLISYRSSANLAIQNSNISASQGINFNVSYRDKNGSDAIQNLKEWVAFGALFNSSERFDAPRCHPNTRTAVLDQLDLWARGTDEAREPIMWLRGPAGSGKSAIAQTLCRLWESKMLAASFFFARAVRGRNEKKFLVPTLAWQLSRRFPSFASHLAQIIEEDTAIFNKDLRTQMEHLIVLPLILMPMDEFEKSSPQTVVIDGLDECSISYDHQDHESQQSEIIDALMTTLMDCELPIKFLISSRPERQIRESLQHLKLKNLLNWLDLNASDNPGADADIALFLRCELDEIRRRNPYLGAAWPADSVISALVQRSSGHFIYASAIARFLRSPRLDPQQGLKIVLTPNDSSAKVNPFTELDALYLRVLGAIHPISIPVISIIHYILIKGPFYSIPRDNAQTNFSPSFFAKHLIMPLSQVYTHLTDLYSLLCVPDSSWDEEANHDKDPITIIHASFVDFLSDASRSGPFSIATIKPEKIMLLHVNHLLRCFAMPWDPSDQDYEFQNNSFYLSEYISDNLPACTDRSPELEKGLEALVSRSSQKIRQYLLQADLADGVDEASMNHRLGSTFRGEEDLLQAVRSYLRRFSQNHFPVLDLYSNSKRPTTVPMLASIAERPEREPIKTSSAPGPRQRSSAGYSSFKRPTTASSSNGRRDPGERRLQTRCRFGCPEAETLHHMFVACPRYETIRGSNMNSLRADIDRILVSYRSSLDRHPRLERAVINTFRDSTVWPNGRSEFFNGNIPPVSSLVDLDRLRHVGDSSLLALVSRIGAEWGATVTRTANEIQRYARHRRPETR